MKLPHLTTKDLVTIALLSSLGGILSTYIGYLGTMINNIIGAPFGAGQFMAGLHVLWILIAVGVTKRKGTATSVGLLKGLVEMFLGSTHGIVVVVISLIQGLIVDAVLFSDKQKAARSIYMYSLAGALSSGSNVIIFQLFFFANIPIWFMAIFFMLAAGSGMIFGGLLTTQILDALEHSGIIHGKRRIVDAEGDAPPEGEALPKRRVIAAIVITFLFLALFTFGAVYYFMFVHTLPGDSVDIEGNVTEPYRFYYDDFQEHEVTILAELNGAVTHLPPTNYTGIPLGIILAQAEPASNATMIVVRAGDGYSATFNLSSAMADDRLILTVEDVGFRLVAGDYEGAYWVEDVAAIEVI